MARADPPAGDADYGGYLARDCVTCHRDGAVDGIPAIAGMPAGAFTAAMLAYRQGRRADPGMRVMAARLGEAEIAALAAYFAGQGQ
ncbi:MAG: c-type cytochrome [Paracoccus sp. (in: a-proteobacteria)]